MVLCPLSYRVVATLPLLTCADPTMSERRVDPACRDGEAALWESIVKSFFFFSFVAYPSWTCIGRKRRTLFTDIHRSVSKGTTSQGSGVGAGGVLSQQQSALGAGTGTAGEQGAGHDIFHGG